MKIMKQVAFEFLKENKTAPFEKIWENTINELSSDWQMIYKKLDITEIKKLKIGELYTMLTSDGEFVRNEKEEWSLSKFYSFEEVQKMKINVGEMGD